MPSSIEKGLIFHAPLNERDGYQDVISETIGTATATYNVIDRQGSGSNRYMSFNGTSDSIVPPPITAFGSNDFSVIFKVNLYISKLHGLIEGSSSGMYILSDGSVIVREGSSTFSSTAKITTYNQDILVSYTRTASVGVFKVNGVDYGNVTDTNVYTTWGEGTLGSYGGNRLNGSISMVRIFNYALTPTQISNYSKQEYPIEATHRGVGATKNILDLNSEGLARRTTTVYNAGYWSDMTNTLEATVSGAIPVISPSSCLGGTWFNGTTSNVVFTGMNGLVGDVTISLWSRNLYTIGYPNIFSNSHFRLYSGGNQLIFSRNNGTTEVIGSASSHPLNSWVNIIITSTSIGVSNIYVNGVLSGSANQAAGNPTSGTTYIIGSGDLIMLCSDIPIWNRILSPDEIKLVYDQGH